MQLKLGEIEIDNKTNILDIDVPAEMEHNIPIGMRVIDRMFAGDGVTPSTVAMLTGMPGAGKSTLAMQIADSITKSGNIALYNTGEESLYQVRRTTKRLNLNNGFYVGYNRSVQEVIKHVKSLQKANPGKSVFLFQDSLQTLELDREEGQRGRPLSGAKAQFLSLAVITEWAKATYGVAFIIGQVNKKGEFSGKNEIKHAIDCHLHLGYVIDDRTGHETACAEMQKNRFGIGNLYYYFDLTEAGVKFRSV